MHFKNKIQLYVLLFPALALLFISSCKKDKETPAVVHETGTMTDIEGNVYKTIKIGNQWWMAENLKTRRYRNGTYLFTSTANTNITVWDTLTKGALCAYNDDNNVTTGYLYNWFAISDTSNIAPLGWHVPTDAEWKTLEQSIGMSASESGKSGWRGTHEGDKLKIEGTSGWTQFGDVWPTNESGFTALAGGCRMFNGTSIANEWSTPQGLQSVGFWWTATGYSDNEAWYRYLDYKNTNIFRSSCSKLYGYSIRCVKDN